jgi:hypothetical protein
LTFEGALKPELIGEITAEDDPTRFPPLVAELQRLLAQEAAKLEDEIGQTLS